MMQWNMVVDVGKCINCHNCALAVQDEFVGNEFPGYSAPMPKHRARWIDIKKAERGQGTMIDVAFLPTMCQHCDDAPCIAASRDGAVKKRPDGIVIIDPTKAKGQKQIVDACPFGAVWWNEELELPQAWFFDAHLLDQGWSEPRCVTVCPTGALQAVKGTEAEWQRRRTQDGLEPLDGKGETRPRVLYKNMYRYRDCFIGGTVIAGKSESEDCVEGANISIVQDEMIVANTVTDGFGEFRFDGLADGSGQYRIVIETSGFERVEREVTLGDSAVLGTIKLTDTI